MAASTVSLPLHREQFLPELPSGSRPFLGVCPSPFRWRCSGRDARLRGAETPSDMAKPQSKELLTTQILGLEQNFSPSDPARAGLGGGELCPPLRYG